MKHTILFDYRYEEVDVTLEGKTFEGAKANFALCTDPFSGFT